MEPGNLDYSHFIYCWSEARHCTRPSLWGWIQDKEQVCWGKVGFGATRPCVHGHHVVHLCGSGPFDLAWEKLRQRSTGLNLWFFSMLCLFKFATSLILTIIIASAIWSWDSQAQLQDQQVLWLYLANILSLNLLCAFSVHLVFITRGT